MADYVLKIRPEMLPQNIRDLFRKYSLGATETPVMESLISTPETVDLIALEEELEKVYEHVGIKTHPEINILFDDWCLHWQGAIDIKSDLTTMVNDFRNTYKMTIEDIVNMIREIEKDG